MLIALTGASGFLGRSMAAALRRAGHRVRALALVAMASFESFEQKPFAADPPADLGREMAKK